MLAGLVHEVIGSPEGLGVEAYDGSRAGPTDDGAPVLVIVRPDAVSRVVMRPGELGLGHRAGRDLLEAHEALALEHRALLALQFPHHVRHADVGEGQVVPAGDLGLVAVVGAQVGVEVVGAAVGAHAEAGARAGDQRQVRRHAAEPLLGLLRVHRDAHRVTDLGAGEDQVLRDLVLGQPDVAQSVVAHEGRGVAVQAVVGEQLGAVLQRRHVGDALLGERVPGHQAGAGGMRRGRRAQAQRQGQQQLREDLDHGCVPRLSAA